MIQLAYRDMNGAEEIPSELYGIPTDLAGGTGETETITKKRNTKSYKTELKSMTKERDKWRKAFKFCALFFAGYIAIDIIYAIFR